MLEVKNLTLHSSESSITKYKNAVREVNLKLEDGYICALLGKNGAGKTTLLNMIYDTVMRKTGSIYFNGYEVNKKTREIYHNDVALVSNDKWYLEHYSVNENIDFLGAMYSRFDINAFDGYLELFEFPATDRSKKMSELSTGQKVQLEIAFAAARKPKLMLLDEPFANLDPIVKTDIMEILQRLVSEEHMSAIISTHLIDEIDEVTDYVAIIDDGRLVSFGDRISLLEGNGYESIKQLLTGRD